MKQFARRQAETMGWPILEPIDAEGVERPVALSKEVCVAGAREQVNLKLPSSLVSRSHAIFVADRDSIYLRDLASRNHTYLNNAQIREAVLRNGDVIGLGPLRFRCQSGFDRSDDRAEVHAPPAELRDESDGSSFPLSGRTSLIGNRRDCDILLRGEDVDPAHAVIYQREGRRFLRDLRSHSYTRVNNEPVKDAELHPGDRIEIGASHLVYHLTPTADETGLPLALDDEEPGKDLATDDPLPGIDELMEAPVPAAHAMEAFDELSPAQSFEKEPHAQAPPNAHAIEPTDDEPIPLPGAALEETDQQDQEESEPELGAAAPIVAPIDEAELDLTSHPKEPEPPEEEIGNEPQPPILDEVTAPSAPGPSEVHVAPAGEEKLTELLGELVETVAKVQSTWEEMKSGSEEVSAINPIEEHEHHPHEGSMD